VSEVTANPEQWRALLRGLGASDAELAAADSEAQLLLLSIDRVLAGDVKYTEAEAGAKAGLDADLTRRLYRALGEPAAARDEASVTDDDVEVLRIVGKLIRDGIYDEDLVLQLARVTGSSMARVAEAQISAALDRVGQRGAQFDPDASGFGDFAEILDVVWRRQLRAAARRHMAMSAVDAGVGQTVGFADLVGFTALSQQLEDHELAHVVDRFEATAYETVTTLGGRVVKTIGDEVMFATEVPAAGIEIALSLAEAYHDDEALSDVRVGLACGPVLEREGDLYGPTVNLASRIVSIAYAASVVTAADIHDQLVDVPDYKWKSIRTRHLKNIGRVQLWTVRRAGDEAEGTFDRARRRRGTIRDKVTDVIDRRTGDSRDASDDDSIESV
jgi:adenylate cyclase